MARKNVQKISMLASRYSSLLISKRKSIALGALLTLPLVLYCLPLLLTGNKLASGDADYLMQTVEAARRSFLEYGQLPWWNPWISGGVPLFANPQFGLLSLPTLFGLIFGSIIGYKIALMGYLIIGFWGFYHLFTKCFKTPIVTAALLSYIWSFGSFFAHRAAGHYTFFTIEFFPFLLLFFLKRKEIRYSWLWLGLVLGLMINAAAHNTTVMCIAVFGVFVLVEIFRLSFRVIKRRVAQFGGVIELFDIKMLVKSGLVAILIAGPRILSSLEYIREYPRSLGIFPEESVGVAKGLFAMFGPFRQYVSVPTIPNWSWMEVSAYIGIMTGLAALICFIVIARNGTLLKNRIGNISPAFIIGLGVVFFLFGLGMIAGKLSPYIILQNLPVFSEMRVASRWIIWSSMMVLVFIALYNSSRHRTLINGLLAISAVELLLFGSVFMAKQYTIPPATYQRAETINQQVHFDVKRHGAVYDENLTATTSSNIGQVIAGDALIDTRQPPPFGANTVRCDNDTVGCNFVMTNNARVETWSPNYITLKRTGPGPIQLNMNPGKYWLVNNTYRFTTMRLTEPDEAFTIDDKSAVIELRLQPKYSPEWVSWKLSGH